MSTTEPRLRCPPARSPAAGGPRPGGATGSCSADTASGLVGLVILGTFVVIALAAPLLADGEGLRVTKATGGVLESPSGEYWLGTDDTGRSVLTMLIWGTRISLLVGLLATAISMLIGTVIGLVSGFFEGWTARLLYRLTEWFLVIPFLPLAIILAVVLGRSLLNIAIVIGVTSWPATALLIRSQTLTIKERPYLERATAARRRALAPDDPARAAQRDADDLRQHDADGRGGDPLGDHAELPGAGRPDPGLVGLDARGGVRGRRDDDGVVVVHRAARDLRGAGRAVVHADRPGAGRGLQPTAAEPLMDHLLELRGLTVAYRTAEGRLPAVRGVDLVVDAGEVVGIAGESGCGKSTLASTVLRLQPKDAVVEGEVLVSGRDVQTMGWGDLRALRWAEAAIVFQGALHSLNPVRRIETQIAEPIRLHEPGLSAAGGRRAGGRAARAGRAAGGAVAGLPAPAVGRASGSG